MTPAPPATEPSPFEFSSGALCLDFVNTLGDRPRSENEKLHSARDLVRWGREAGLVDEARRERLRRGIERRPGDATRIFGDAVDLREALFAIFSALAAGRGSPGPALSRLNETLARALPSLRLMDAGDRFHWDWKGGTGTLDRLVWPVARSAAELLVSEELADLRECGSESCSWLFLDRSRNRRRRWCDMKTCGNRAKARRHYRRHRGS